MRIRTAGRVAGLLAGLVGLAGWLFALLIAVSGDSLNLISVIFFVVMLLSVAGVAYGAYRTEPEGRPRRFGLLVMATLLLLLGTVVSGFTVGFLFLPASALALLAALLTFAASRTAAG